MATTQVSPADLGFDPSSMDFLADPYPVFRALREAGDALYYPERDIWLLTRFADVHAALRHRSLGRIYTHRYNLPTSAGRSRAGRR